MAIRLDHQGTNNQCPAFGGGSVPSLIPRSRATCAIAFPVSRTIRTAPSRNSWSNFLRYDQLSRKTAIQFANYPLDKLPFRVEAILTDNGSEFQTAVHWHLADRGIPPRGAWRVS